MLEGGAINTLCFLGLGRFLSYRRKGVAQLWLQGGWFLVIGGL